MDVREVALTLDFCTRVGELLIASGTGAADAVDTMGMVARALGLRNCDIDITFVTVAMQCQPSPDEPPITASRLVKSRAIDYEHLTRVDHLIRDVVRGDVDVRAARQRLGRITSTGHSRPRWAATLGLAVMAAAVAVQLGGDGAVALLAFVSAALIDRIQLVLSRQRIPMFYQQIAGAGVASLLAVATAATPLDVDVSSAITANIVVLLAGIGLMGALQDGLSGFYITANARVLEAMLSTAGIIAGVSAGLTMASSLGVDIPVIAPGATNLQGVGLTLLGSAVGASAFAYSCYAPGRILVPIAVISAVAMGIATALRDMGRAWPVAVAAFVIGLVAYGVAARMRVPPLVIVVPAMVPMLPGISIYRGLTLLLSDQGPNSTPEGLLALFTAVTIAVSLAAGVILGEYVAQPLKRGGRRLEARLAGPRLVGPLRGGR
ncbi:MAG: threonine/serine ThrE exporter family protein [Nocardioides sp.]